MEGEEGIRNATMHTSQKFLVLAGIHGLQPVLYEMSDVGQESRMRGLSPKKLRLVLCAAPFHVFPPYC